MIQLNTNTTINTDTMPALYDHAITEFYILAKQYHKAATASTKQLRIKLIHEFGLTLAARGLDLNTQEAIVHAVINQAGNLIRASECQSISGKRLEHFTMRILTHYNILH